MMSQQVRRDSQCHTQFRWREVTAHQHVHQLQPYGFSQRRVVGHALPEIRFDATHSRGVLRFH